MGQTVRAMPFFVQRLSGEEEPTVEVSPIAPQANPGRFVVIIRISPMAGFTCIRDTLCPNGDSVTFVQAKKKRQLMDTGFAPPRC